MAIAISSGHGKYIRGASGYLDEVDEARRVVDRVAELLTDAGVEVFVFHDNVSDEQSENLDRIVSWHDQQSRDLDVSVHFNAYEETTKPMGTECLYLTQQAIAADMSAAIAAATGLPNRGAKKRTDLAFLNGTDEPAILIETVFVDSSADAAAYEENFEEICAVITHVLSGEEIAPVPEPPTLPEGQFYARGKCSHFGGPDDTGVNAGEGLAFLYKYDDAPHLFLPEQPPGTSGLARRLNPNIFYVACRWDYGVTSKMDLANPSRQAIVRAGGREFYAWPADWGPHENTDRIADLSPGLMAALGLDTDDEVEIVYPA
jgi:N-acetylmuramoyl-L-alanine amidase